MTAVSLVGRAGENDLGFRGLRADALFASGLQRRDDPGAAQVRRAIAAATRALGCSGCAGRVAQEFGDHPETAVIRMRWAHAAARAAFAESAKQPDPRADARGMLIARPRRAAEQVADALGPGPRGRAVFLAGGAVT
jgi:hypothetical protein